MTGDTIDIGFMQRAIELALESEKTGNLPVGAVITLENSIIAEGASTIITPCYDPRRHAEMNALDNVDINLWRRAGEMTCYTTLEPCCMCFGRLLLAGVGRIVFGAFDTEGGSGCLIKHLPRFYNNNNTPRWTGPIMPEQCNPLFQRTFAIFSRLCK